MNTRIIANPIYALFQSSGQFNDSAKRQSFIVNGQPRLRGEFRGGEQESYLMVFLNDATGKPAGQGDVIIINQEQYVMQESHVSIFQHFLMAEDSIGKRASYHLTMEVVREDQLYKLRVYFNHFFNASYIQLKKVINGSEEEVRIVKGKYLGEVAKTYLQTFLVELLALYNKKSQENIAAYHTLEGELQSLSEKAFDHHHPTMRNDLEKYKDKLLEIIGVLEARYQFEFYRDEAMFCHFKRALRYVESKLNPQHQVVLADDEQDADVTVAVQAEVIAVNQVDLKKTKKEKLKNKAQKEIIEIDLALARELKKTRRYLLLLRKFEAYCDSDDSEKMIDCQLDISRLRREADEDFKQLMMSTSGEYSDMSDEDLDTLVGMKVAVQLQDIFFAINNNRVRALAALLKHAHNLNLSAKLGPKTMLEFAYAKKNFVVFKMLLDAGASCDVVDQQGRTLLMRACEDGRDWEMLALLQFGATDKLKDHQGRTALSRLMEDAANADKREMLPVFLRGCQSLDINASCNFFVANKWVEYTPIVFACFQEWHVIVDIMLEHGKDPIERLKEPTATVHDYTILFSPVPTLTRVIASSAVSMAPICKKVITNIDKYRHPNLDPLKNKNIIAFLKQNIAISEEVVNEKHQAFSPFYQAVRKGDVALLASLLTKKSNLNDLNKVMKDGWTPLTLAVRLGDEKVVNQLLVHEDIKLNLCNASGFSPIMLAVRYNRLNVIRALLKSQKKRKGEALEGMDPCLVVASYLDAVDIVTELLDHDYDPNCATKKGVTALGVAVKMGHVEVVKVLLTHKNSRARINVNQLHLGEPPLMMAACAGQLNMVELLLEHERIDVNMAAPKNLVTSLYMAAQYGYVDVVRALLTNRKIRVNQVVINGASALTVASAEGNGEVVRTLLKAPGIIASHEISQRQSSPLVMAASEGFEEIVRLLLTNKCVRESVNHIGILGAPAFYLAAQNGHVGVMRILLNESNIQLNVNATNAVGVSPLLAASARGHLNAVRCLIEESHRYHVDVNLGDSEGVTPLCAAVEGKHSDVVSCLLTHADIDLNAKTPDGASPLLFAMALKNAPMVHQFLMHPRILVEPDFEECVREFFPDNNELIALTIKRIEEQKSAIALTDCVATLFSRMASESAVCEVKQQASAANTFKG